MDAETIRENINWFFGSNWTGHIGFGALAWFLAALIGKTEYLWGELSTLTLIVGAVGVAGVTYSVDQCIAWIFGDG